MGVRSGLILGFIRNPVFSEFALTKLFLEFLVTGDSSSSYGAELFCVLVALLLAHLFLIHHLAYFYYSLLRVVIRKALIGLLYEKLLKLSHESVTSATVGKLISLSSGDLNQLERGTGDLTNLVVSPVASLFNLLLIYFLVILTISLDRPSRFLHLGCFILCIYAVYSFF